MNLFYLISCANFVREVHAFSPYFSHLSPLTKKSHVTATASCSRSTKKILHATREKDWLMDEFKTSDGNIVDPYKILNLKRDASRSDIRRSYLKLSKLYHPDAIRYSDRLPGNCMNVHQVRDQWERIKLSYEILSDRKRRLKYGRHSVINDPGDALSRAAIDMTMWGISGLKKGILGIGKQKSETKDDVIIKDKILNEVRIEKNKDIEKTSKTVRKYTIEKVDETQTIEEKRMSEKVRQETADFEEHQVLTEKQTNEEQDKLVKVHVRVEGLSQIQEEAHLRKEACITEETSIAEETSIIEEEHLLEEERRRKILKQQQIAADILKSVATQQISLRREN